MISKQVAQDVLLCALSGGADFAEIYGEITRNNQVRMVDGKIERATDELISGVGIRAFLGTRTVFASTSDTTRDGLLKCARAVAAAMGELRKIEHISLSERLFPNIHPARVIPTSTDAKLRAELLRAGWDVGVAWQDGRQHGGTTHIRVNLALPHSRVKEAFDRLDRYVFNK